MTDMAIRIFISPKYSPSLVIARFLVRNQTPLYVGAAQKKFAWYIGLVLSATMFILMVIINSFSYITGIVCLICLILMFFETAFGICLGCKIYKTFNKEKVQYCPGEVCDPKAKQDIQKTSKIQLAVVLILISFILLIAIRFNEKFKEKPFNLLETKKSERVK